MWRRFVPLFALLVLCCLALLLSSLFWHRLQADLQPKVTARFSNTAWQRWLPGQQLDLPSQAGLWWLPRPQGNLLFNRAQRLGHHESINLCQQRSLAPRDLARMLPLHMAGWGALQQQAQGHVMRNAVLLPPTMAENLPPLQLEGQVAGDLAGVQWHLAPMAGADWAFISDTDPAVNAAALAHGQARAQMPAMRARQQAWLLWGRMRPLDATTTAQGFRYGLHILSVPRACDAPRAAGATLELRLYSADKINSVDAAGGNDRLSSAENSASYRAVHALAMSPLHFFPLSADVIVGDAAPGKWHIAQADEAPLEDQELFQALLASGLLRLQQTVPARIALAPPDLLLARLMANDLGKESGKDMGNTVSDIWQPSVMASDAMLAQLLKRLYQKADGAAVRRQVAAFNLGDQMSQIQLQKQANGAQGLQWRQAVPRGIKTEPKREAWQVTTREGNVLFQAKGMTSLAQELGLAPWFAKDGNTLANFRPANSGMVNSAQHSTALQLSIEGRMQALAHQVLTCHALKQGQWRDAHCLPNVSTRNTDISPQRSARFIVLDAANGEILAAASVSQTAQQRILPPWQHDGRSIHSPGSTFKLMDALAFEQLAQRDAELGSLLQGADLSRLQTLGRPLGFNMTAPCYPSPCDGGRQSVQNFHQASAISYAKHGRFGLQQALGHSVNSWFAWLAERSDASVNAVPANQNDVGSSVAAKMADLRYFGAEGVAPVRPIVGLAQQLGFERGFALDGAARPGEFLHSTPSHFAHSADARQLRLVALGQGVQTTPLQMAMLAAGIATGRQAMPSLIARSAPSQSAGIKFTMRLDRLHAAMQEVVQHGTAQAAFAGADLQALRLGLFGKTGTAETAAADGSLVAGNSAWFVGFLRPNSIVGECRTLAFAVQISHSQMTGGALAAPVVAEFLRDWQKEVAGRDCSTKKAL